jgi:5-enolpyruvylshikimate-3-phosphate synthase
MSGVMTRRCRSGTSPREISEVEAPVELKIAQALTRAVSLSARRSGPLTGRVRPPGDKSISHRAFILGLLSVGETRIDGLLEGDDVRRTGEACRALGAVVERLGDGAWRVRGRGIGALRAPGHSISAMPAPAHGS